MVSVLIPTMGRETLSMIMSNAISEVTEEIIVLDSGEIPVISRDEIMIVSEVASRKGISVTFLREKMGIGKARFRLLQEAKSEYAMMIDDDVWLASADIKRLSQVMKLYGKGFVVPCCHIAADFLGAKNMHREAVSVQQARELSQGDWQMPYFNYKQKEALYVPIRFSGTQCVMFPTENGFKAPLLEKWKDGMNREDIYFTSEIGPGVLCTRIVSVHMETTRQKREWSNRDEDVGYSLVINGELDRYVE